MPTQMHLRVWTVQDEETDDWIKNVVGEDGLTSREREMKLYAEMDKKRAENDDLLVNAETQ